MHIVRAKAGVSLSQLVADGNAWIMLGARLFRILLVSCAVTTLYGIDLLLSCQLLTDNQRTSGAYYIITNVVTVIVTIVLLFVNFDVYAIAYAAVSRVEQSELSTSTPATPSSWARISRIGRLLLVLATLFLYQLLLLSSSIICIVLVGLMYVEHRYAFSIMSYAAVVIQIAVVVFLIRGGKQAVVFLVGEQFPPASTLPTEVPMQASLPIEGGEGSSEGNGIVSVTSFSTATTTSAVTPPANALSSMRSALSDLAANLSLSNPSAYVADGAYSALSAEDSIHGLHSNMVVVTGVPVIPRVAGQREGSTNVILRNK